MTETRRKGDVAADRSGNVPTNGELADLPRASGHGWGSNPEGRLTCDVEIEL